MLKKWLIYTFADKNRGLQVADEFGRSSMSLKRKPRALARAGLHFLLLGVMVGACACAEAAVPSRQLLENARGFDGHAVEYAGEAIGEILKRDDYAWVSLYDGESAISVWLPASLAGRIEFLGNYKKTGDFVFVRGVFHRSCLEHGGAMDIHGMELEILRPGAIRPEILVKKKIVTVLWLLGVLACLLIVHIIQDRRRRT